VRRLLQVILLYAILAQATGLTWAATENACTTQCDDDRGDDRGGQCPPNCPDCVCSVHVPATFAAVPVVVVLPLPPPRRVMFIEPRRAAPAPSPREILHVPRSRLG
jgi:hypothetical protein